MGHTNGFMSRAQRELATQVLDLMVPARYGLPGAGEIGVAGYLDGAGGASLSLRHVLIDVLIAIETVSHFEFATSFAGLSGDQKTGVLSQVESEQGPLFTEFLRRTYIGYYSESMVLDALRIDPRPPQPRGYTLAPFDHAVLERVRKRDQLYRDV